MPKETLEKFKKACRVKYTDTEGRSSTVTYNKLAEQMYKRAEAHPNQYRGFEYTQLKNGNGKFSSRWIDDLIGVCLYHVEKINPNLSALIRHSFEDIYEPVDYSKIETLLSEIEHKCDPSSDKLIYLDPDIVRAIDQSKELIAELPTEGAQTHLSKEIIMLLYIYLTSPTGEYPNRKITLFIKSHNRRLLGVLCILLHLHECQHIATSALDASVSDILEAMENEDCSLTEIQLTSQVFRCVSNRISIISLNKDDFKQYKESSRYEPTGKEVISTHPIYDFLCSMNMSFFKFNCGEKDEYFYSIARDRFHSLNEDRDSDLIKKRLRYPKLWSKYDKDPFVRPNILECLSEVRDLFTDYGFNIHFPK